MKSNEKFQPKNKVKCKEEINKPPNQWFLPFTTS